MVLTHESYIFDPRPYYPLLATANRYLCPDSLHSNDPDALTLVFVHATGFHKEIWEPTMEDLYSFAERSELKIREMWSIDAPNHGEAAMLNEKSLLWGYEPIFGWEEYARCLHAFLAGLGSGINVEFRTHTLVGIGHSMGAISLLLSHGYYPRLRFSALILCEPMMMAREFSAQGGLNLSDTSEKRRDIWASKQEAYTIMKSRETWKKWDDRVLKIYTNYGLRSLPTAAYPDLTEGVTLTCTRAQETACYRDALGSSRAYILLRHIVRKVPIHIIYGALNDRVPYAAQDDVVRVATGGARFLASLSRVEDAGHLV
ncbi:Alpha/beta hydrolase fold-1 [Amanita rubescens]|nr:Alpha/beta hydrolase fold-1 [Amanita rubescens]